MIEYLPRKLRLLAKRNVIEPSVIIASQNSNITFNKYLKDCKRLRRLQRKYFHMLQLSVTVKTLEVNILAPNKTSGSTIAYLASNCR